MNILIEIKNKQARIVLRDGEAATDEFVFPDEYRISSDLLPEIEKLIRKNGLEREDIGEIEVETDLGESFTSRRIAEATANAFNWAKEKV